MGLTNHFFSESISFVNGNQFCDAAIRNLDFDERLVHDELRNTNVSQRTSTE